MFNNTERMHSNLSKEIFDAVVTSGIIYSNTINEGAQNISADQFMYLGSNASAIGTTVTNPFGRSPNLTANAMYEFEYWIGLSNSSTGVINMGWANTSVSRIVADICVLPAVNGTAYAGVNPRTSTANANITGGNTAATHWIKIRGFVVNGSTTKRLPFQVSVSAGSITPLFGSWFKFTNRGVSELGASNIIYGNVS